jgi:ComF family protein
MNFNLYRPLSQALNWFAPHKCFGCKKTISQAAAFCNACYQELPFQSRTCTQCGQTIGADSDHCGQCIIAPPYYDECFCPFEYQTPIKDLICALKYNDRAEYAKIVGRLLASEVKQNQTSLPDVIIPVPIHISRLRSRGFNQAKLIADEVGKELNIKVLNSTLTKTRATLPQAQQSLINRKKALRNCFALQKKLSAQNVAIIDDVVTTGSTVNEIAKILKKNGVDYIQVWGLAHTL